MPWTERQRAMLAEIGVPLWFAPAAEAAMESQATPLVPPTPVATESAREVKIVMTEVSSSISQPLLQRVDVATMDWPALRQAVADCTACALCESRRQTVFGVGHPRSHWMVVGEAPGEQEDRQGEPFVGKSGQLLDNMLRAIRLTRNLPAEGEAELRTPADPARQVYIANTLKCRPPGNRNPEPDELQKCEAFLVRQIELVQPRIILAMGRFAVQSLLRSKEPIGRLRGRVHRYQGVPLIVTYHPAYLLRNLEDKARAWEDLCLALDTLESLGPPQP